MRKAKHILIAMIAGTATFACTNGQRTPQSLEANVTENNHETGEPKVENTPAIEATQLAPDPITTPLQCSEFEPVATEWAARYGLDQLDCGTLDARSSQQSWEEGRDCVLKAVASKRSFRAAFRGRGIDSMVANAYVGVAGVPYRLETLWWDASVHAPRDPSEVKYATAMVRSCPAIVEIPDCKVMPLKSCIYCVYQDKPGVDLCEH
jgi:hypothetical protein